MAHFDRITVNPETCGGRPCIRGMRVRVKDILDMLAANASRTEILSDYPYLEDEDITAALEYAALQADHPVLDRWFFFLKNAEDLESVVVDDALIAAKTGLTRDEVQRLRGEQRVVNCVRSSQMDYMMNLMSLLPAGRSA